MSDLTDCPFCDGRGWREPSGKLCMCLLVPPQYPRKPAGKLPVAVMEQIEKARKRVDDGDARDFNPFTTDDERDSENGCG